MDCVSRRRSGNADCDSDHGEREGGADEHPLEFVLLRAEGETDADFAGALRDGVRDDSVDADDAERERHGAGDREHGQRE